MGDTVNLAARLMAKARPGQVLATREVLDGSRTLFETDSAGAVLRQREEASGPGLRGRRPDRQSGRRQTLPHRSSGGTRNWRSSARPGSRRRHRTGRLVELVAEPGMGKTRLLQEFLLRWGDSRIVRAECRLYQATTPYFPFRRHRPPGPQPRKGSVRMRPWRDCKLDVKESAPFLAPWLALIGVVLDVEIEPSPEVAQLDDQFRPARTLAAVGSLLEAVVRARTLFVIEDTHWMDDASRELLAGLCRVWSDCPG